MNPAAHNQFQWVMTEEQRSAWTSEFRSHVQNGTHMSGDLARSVFTHPSQKLTPNVDLAAIWVLADQNKDLKLNLTEYMYASFLIYAQKQGIPLPKTLPASLIESTKPVTPRIALPTRKPKPLWEISKENFARYFQLFKDHSQPPAYSFVSAASVLALFTRSGTQLPTLSKIWHLAERGHDNILVLEEFIVALHLLALHLKGHELPETAPPELFASAASHVASNPHTTGHAPSSSSPPSSTPATPSTSPPAPLAIPLTSPTPHQPQPAQPVSTPQPVPGSPFAHTPLAREASTNPFQPFAPKPQPATSHATFHTPNFVPFGLPPQPSNAPNQHFVASPNANPFSNQAHPPLNISKILGSFNFKLPPKEPEPAPPPPDNRPDYEKDLNGVPKLDPKDIHRDLVVGTGAFSSVWKGTWNGETVAIKDVNYHNDREIEMWKREVQILGKAQVTNIHSSLEIVSNVCRLLSGSEYLVSIRGYAVTPEFLTIVMEFMEQGSLFDIIHKKRNVTWSMLQKVYILKHLTQGLLALHQRQVVHRDVKSMNILVDSKSNVKLADLGCSRILGPRQETMTIGIGTPLWMAPEILTGSYSYPSDIFGLGVIIFELLNEKLPEYNAQKKRVIIPPDAVGHSLIEECIHKNPNARPTATQLIGSMDVLTRSFVAAVARIVIRSCSDAGAMKTFPPEDDLNGWFKLLLSYDRNTFDVLLGKALTMGQT